VKNPKVLNALLDGIEKLKNEQNNLLLSTEIISNGSSQRSKKIQEGED